MQLSAAGDFGLLTLVEAQGASLGASDTLRMVKAIFEDVAAKARACRVQVGMGMPSLLASVGDAAASVAPTLERSDEVARQVELILASRGSSGSTPASGSSVPRGQQRLQPAQSAQQSQPTGARARKRARTSAAPAGGQLQPQPQSQPQQQQQPQQRQQQQQQQQPQQQQQQRQQQQQQPPPPQQQQRQQQQQQPQQPASGGALRTSPEQALAKLRAGTELVGVRGVGGQVEVVCAFEALLAEAGVAADGMPCPWFTLSQGTCQKASRGRCARCTAGATVARGTVDAAVAQLRPRVAQEAKVLFTLLA